jgi:hypothetical protein
MVREGGLLGGGEALNPLKQWLKIVFCCFFTMPPSLVNFALENDLKGLAFCAARSHIVAVR